MARILYVEDNLDTANAVKLILKSAGHEIELASNGKEGIEKAKSGFDLILLDIMLPDMSGWDIFGKLRNKGYSKKYAFLSAIPVSSERLAELKRAGVSGYITKPFTKEGLIEDVEKILK
ncbi:response regulator [Candidatus Pacearchaeota archaeon]|nr:MAG: response regulator [Candidatus Pacearchaeota archaeon]